MNDGESSKVWQTFTFRLPFTLGLTFTGWEHHVIRVPAPPAWPETEVWADPLSAKTYGPVGIVRLKFYAVRKTGVEMFPPGLESALQGLYPGSDFGPGDESWPMLGEESSEIYDQWVSAETAAERLAWEGAGDEAFAFHRALAALNLFLVGYAVGLGSTHVHPLSPEDLDPIIVLGKLNAAGSKWFDPGVLMMPLEWTPRPLSLLDVDTTAPRIGSGIEAVLASHPYVPVKIWLSRSLRAKRRGDQVDRVVSLQTAAETLFSATYRMTMVDAGKSAAEIQSEAQYDAFKWLVGTRLPQLVGGDWHLQRPGSEPGRYWVDLYELRNRIVHGGYEPAADEGDRAEAAFRRVREFLNQRLWARRKEYPRTMLARIGDPEGAGFTNGGRWLKELRARLKSEPGVWWWPWDLAGRNSATSETINGE